MSDLKLFFLDRRVEGSHGPLVANPNSNEKRRGLSRAVGTVVMARYQHEWEVLFDYNSMVKYVIQNHSQLFHSKQEFHCTKKNLM